MRDLVFVSLENWDEIWRRNQFLCAAYARRHSKAKILFVAPPKDVTNALRRGRFGDLRGATTWTVPHLPNVRVTRPNKFAPNTLEVGRRWNDWMARRHVRRAMEECGVRWPVLWLNPHSAVHMAGRMGEAAVVYDITDDWTSMTQSPRLAQLVAEQDAALCRRADAVIVCSQRLLELKRSMARRLALIPNGVDADHYARVLDGSGLRPPGSDAWPKPVFGYTGTVHCDRVDVPLVQAVARSMPSGSIVLVGPNHLCSEDVRRLTGTGRVFLTGPVPYARIPEYMRAFDVCIVPHRMTAFTESLNPIKLWEYLAAGKPIVSTDVAGFRDYPELVRIVSGAEAFTAALWQALTEGDEKAVARRREARRHSWERRLDDVEDVIASCLDDGRERLPESAHV